jgi:cytochrome c oxidase assembly protein Cox11
MISGREKREPEVNAKGGPMDKRKNKRKTKRHLAVPVVLAALLIGLAGFAYAEAGLLQIVAGNAGP